MQITKSKNGFSVTAYVGDAKTLLAFNLAKPASKNLAGFTIAYTFPKSPTYYLFNELQFENPSAHAQVATQPPTSTINAPIRKFRWLHVPGSLNQGTSPFYGAYQYTVTPRYFDDKGSLLAIDPSLNVTVQVNVGPFVKGSVELGFTRGFVQSEAFTHHFGAKALFRPNNKNLIFNTSASAGRNTKGQDFTFADEYNWSGFTARTKIMGILDEVASDSSLSLRVFAYDLNEPDVINQLLAIAKKGRVKIILDNAALHHNKAGTKPEDQFEKLFRKAAKDEDDIIRGKFGRYSHDKIFIVSKNDTPVKVLSGSTNLSVTGMYVNSNHVIIFNDPTVAAAYAGIFDESWSDKASKAFANTPDASKVFTFGPGKTPKTSITFSPHPTTFTAKVLGDLATRVKQEGKQKTKGSVLFAVMGLAVGGGPVLPALKSIHTAQDIFSYGISDSPGGIYLYRPKQKSGVLVSGKPGNPILPPPFDQVASVGKGHQVHHKFVVCGFNGSNPVVYLGSSNLTSGGECANGDNLIAIYDGDIATAFAIEALALVDHFDFLDSCSKNAKARPAKSGSRQAKAQSAQWFLTPNAKWVESYFDPSDLHCTDRLLFGS
ncbi:MAG TPA: phospholipase D-like domain-containing protein [Opitutaceae bacterium]